MTNLMNFAIRGARHLTAIAVMLIGVQASAEWYQADTAHFRVYSNSNAKTATETAVMMERLDEAMRFMLKVPPDQREPAISEKLTLYQFGTSRDIGALIKQKGVAGFFIPRGGNTVAFSPLKEDRQRGTKGYNRNEDGLDPQTVLFHEYAHYFMYRHAPAAYPWWYREGFAEVYGTLELLKDGFVLGSPANHRASIIRFLRSYKIEDLFVGRDKYRGRDVMAAYGHGWLLSHYLTFSGERDGQLKKYLDLLNQRVPSLEAAKQAFGDLDELQSDVRAYSGRRLTGKSVSFDNYQPPKASVRRLSDAEAASMEIQAKSKSGVDHDMALDLVGSARQLAADYAASAMAQLTAAEAFFDARLLDEAEKSARRAENIDPDDAIANLYLGRIALTRAVGFTPNEKSEWPAIEADPSQFDIALEQYALASRKDRYNPAALHEFYIAHAMSGKPVPENALIALEDAYFRAQFDDEFRTTLGHLLLLENRDQEALNVLGPVINNPHTTKHNVKLNRLITEMEEGEGSRDDVMQMLSPSPSWLAQPEPEDEDEGTDDGENQ